MKRLFLLSILLTICSLSKAQSISYNQIIDIFKTWKIRKDVSTLPILNKLRAIDLNWEMHSRGKSEYTRYYTWSYADKKHDTTAVALYIEEDDDSIKYGLRYAFYDRATYLGFQQAIVGSGEYEGGRLTYFSDKSKHQFTTTGRANDSSPIESRTDLILTDYADTNDDTPRLFTLDISSRYIKK